MFHGRSDLNFKVHSNCLTLLWTTCSSIKDLSRERKTVTALCYAHLLTKQKIIELYVYQLGEIWVQNLAKTKPKGKWK